ncbi:MAG: hypothetical protein HYX51_07455 [Chloroflexi bacterium]|nr:hypothetical protein [Chloroflexota bacterium]
MLELSDIAQWVLVKTPTIKGDDGAFLIAVLFLVVGLGGLALWVLTWMMTGGTDVSGDPSYGKPKGDQ